MVDIDDGVIEQRLRRRRHGIEFPLPGTRVRPGSAMRIADAPPFRRPSRRPDRSSRRPSCRCPTRLVRTVASERIGETVARRRRISPSTVEGAKYNRHPGQSRPRAPWLPAASGRRPRACEHRTRRRPCARRRAVARAVLSECRAGTIQCQPVDAAQRFVECAIDAGKLPPRSADRRPAGPRGRRAVPHWRRDSFPACSACLRRRVSDRRQRPCSRGVFEMGHEVSWG